MSKQVGRHRTACAACRRARKKCDGEVPCSRCIQAHVACVPVGLEQSRVGKRPLPVSGAENGAAGLGEPPVSHVRHRPPTAAVRTDPPSSHVSDESLVSTGTTTSSHEIGGGKSSGMMATLGTGLSTAPPDIPQGSASQPALPMSCLERGQGDVGLSLGTAVTMGGCEEKVSPPPVPPAAGVYVAGGEEGGIHAVAGNATAFGEEMPQEGQSHEDWTSVSLEKSHIEVQEGHMDAGSGDMAEEAGDCGVVRPIGEIDNLAVAFEVACRGVPELSLEGKLDINRASFILTGLDFAFLLMGSGFSYPAFLRVLRHYVTFGKPQANALPASRLASAADSASTAMSFLVGHAMAVADPHYRPPPFDPSSVTAPASDRPVSSEYLSSQDNQSRGSIPLIASLSGPLVAPSLYIPQQQEHEWVAGPNGIRHLISRGSALDRRRPGDVTPQVSWINELWSDPQAAACSFSIMELQGQPILALRTNAYMAKEFVDERELALMSDQLKTMAPMLLARFMTSASTTRFFTLLSHNLSYENGEGDCFVEMINRRGQLVDCLATIRWHYGAQHSLAAARFTPLSSLNTNPTKQPTLSSHLNPDLFSIISSMASDAAHRCAVSSVPSDESLPVSASPRPALSASLGGQASWPLLAPSAAPSPTRQAWPNLPTARLGGSGGEVERLPLQSLQAPLPPITSAALAAPAGPRSSTVAQAAAPMVAGSAWPSWAAVAGEDAACYVGRVATSPVLCKEASDDTSLQPSARLPVSDVVSGVNFDDEEMQLLLDSIA